MSRIFSFFVYLIFTFMNLTGFECSKLNREKLGFNSTMKVHRSDPYRMITYEKERIILHSLIGFLESNKLVAGGIVPETETIFKHAKEILERNGSSLDDVISVKINLDDISNYAIVDDIFNKYFQKPYPQKSINESLKMPLKAKVEMDIFAKIYFNKLFPNSTIFKD